MSAIKIIASVIIFGALTGQTTALATQVTIQCINLASGTSWSLQVDDRQQTVDGVPAHISEASISWRDTVSGGAFDLDRASGVLTFTNASSTGGYILRHRCRLNY